MIIDALVFNFGELSADLEKIKILPAVRRINEVYIVINRLETTGNIPLLYQYNMLLLVKRKRGYLIQSHQTTLEDPSLKLYSQQTG
jgi:hypothetical protein